MTATTNRCSSQATTRPSSRQKQDQATSGQTQFYKTKMCPIFLKSKVHHPKYAGLFALNIGNLEGTCANGDPCRFAHSLRDLRPLPDLTRTKLCASFNKGVTCNLKKCPFAHSPEELRTSSSVFYKVSLCNFYKNNKCWNGANCRFAHGAQELKENLDRLHQAKKNGELNEFDELIWQQVMSSAKSKEALSAEWQRRAVASTKKVDLDDRFSAGKKLETDETSFVGSVETESTCSTRRKAIIDKSIMKQEFSPVTVHTKTGKGRSRTKSSVSVTCVNCKAASNTAECNLQSNNLSVTSRLCANNDANAIDYSFAKDLFMMPTENKELKQSVWNGDVSSNILDDPESAETLLKLVLEGWD